MFSQGSYHEIFEQDIRTIFKNSKSDFMVLSVREIKEQSQAQKLQKKFIQTNCSNLIGDAKTNCIIWLNTLAGEVPTSAIKKMHRIIARNPYRADYWDTLGVLLIERNQRKEAKEAFRTAAIHDPSNPYMLFQYHWFSNK
jgi:predicted Zn-dependent protease